MEQAKTAVAEAAEQATETKKYITFFTVNTEGKAPKVHKRAHYEDIREKVLVEQVAARMDHKPITYQDIANAFPEALAAARQHAEMKREVGEAKKKLQGPFKVITDGTATDEQLLTWFKNKQQRGSV
jgi:hypothetical protein